VLSGECRGITVFLCAGGVSRIASEFSSGIYLQKLFHDFLRDSQARKVHQLTRITPRRTIETSSAQGMKPKISTLA
jgi:hypothetical protein